MLGTLGDSDMFVNIFEFSQRIRDGLIHLLLILDPAKTLLLEGYNINRAC